MNMVFVRCFLRGRLDLVHESSTRSCAAVRGLLPVLTSGAIEAFDLYHVWLHLKSCGRCAMKVAKQIHEDAD